MIRATKNPILKISPQNFCQTCSAWNPNAWNSTGVSLSQKHHTSALVKKSNSKYSKHTLLQCFFELNLGWTETHENPHNKNNRMILFFCLLVSNQQWKNDISVVLFSYGEKINNIKRKMLVKCVCFCASVPCPCLQVCVVPKISTPRSPFQIYGF